MKTVLNARVRSFVPIFVEIADFSRYLPYITRPGERHHDPRVNRSTQRKCTDVLHLSGFNSIQYNLYANIPLYSYLSHSGDSLLKLKMQACVLGTKGPALGGTRANKIKA